MAWTEATVTLLSVRFAKEECGQNISKMEQFVQCSFEHFVQTGMFQYG
jgi:ATP-dependent helicase/DNAse subunit B